MKLRQLIIAFLLIISICARSQSARMYTSDSHLSSSLINNMYQDSKGYIWTATEDGLNKYDGAKFVVYRHKKKMPGSALNNYVKAIFEDRDKNLLFGFVNGLQIYNHATDSFTNIPMLTKSKEELNPHVSFIIQRKNGDILVSTYGYGIFEVDLKKPKPTAKTISLPIDGSLIHEIKEDKSGNLWILTQDGGLWVIDTNYNVRQYFFSEEHLANTSSICEDKNGNLYVGTLNHGLFIYDKIRRKFDPVDASAPLPVKKLFVDKNNTILIGTDGMGLYVYDTIKKKIAVANMNITNFDFSTSKIHSILVDKNGNLWMGLYQKGILLLPPNENNFNYLGFQSVTNNVIGSNAVMSVHKDKKGILWVGTDGDGIYAISPANKREHHYKIEKNGFGKITVMCIFEDSNNDLWIGTYLHGLAKLNRNTNKFDFIRNIPEYQNKSPESILTITEDNDKKLWIGTLGAGLYTLDLKTQKVVNNDANAEGSKNTLKNLYVNCLLVTKEGRLYIGTYDGLYCYDIKTKNYLQTATSNHILDHKIIYSLHEDHSGNLWIGSSEGLIFKPRGNQSPKLYTTDDNLPSNIICAIEEDSNKNLWVSTSHGISKFSYQSKKFFNFYFNDGLQGNEFSKNASFADKDGNIIFGGMKGVTYFYPHKIKSKGKSTNVYITGFYIHNKSVKKGMKSDKFEIVNSALIDAKTVDLGYEDNSFSIEFSTMDFSNQQNITYFYSLENNKWNKLQQGINNITFDNLQPGNYKFKVKAEVYGKYSNVRELSITIHPVWYFSFWAKCFYWVLFFALLYLVVSYFNQREITKNKIQEHLQNKKINEAKLQFLTNISHDIKSPLSLVMNPLIKLMKIDQDDSRQKWYQIMYRNSEKILQLLNQIKDVQKLDQGQISLNLEKTEVIATIEELCLLFEDQIQAKNIELNFHHQKPNIYAWVDPKYFDRIIQNILSNAIKFVHEKGIIEVFTDEKYLLDDKGKEQLHLVITIVDNGIGLNGKDIKRIFDRFYQAKNGKAHHAEGTGIGLHITKSIVELHNGTITADNNSEGTGCSFTISIPSGHKNSEKNQLDENSELQHSAGSTIPIISTHDEELINSSASKKSVLVVDDNTEVSQYIYKELSAYYKVLTCSNGKDALDIVLKEPLDLIITDINMPVMDGVTLCRKIKKNININHIPIILLTGRSHDQDQLEGLNIGADAYITKPFNMEILKTTAINLIKNRELLKNNYSGNQAQEDKIKKITMESADEKLMQKVMNFINNNISDPSLNVEMIANDIGISRVHLHRKLKELTNQSSRDLIRNIRLKQAGDLLANKQTNISEVAYLVGFSNVSKFSTTFKQFYGVPPKLYMQEHLNVTEKDNTDPEVS